nr:MAG TPA: Tombusvirus movement protein [Caudoviricetes sp.]
MYCVGKDQVAPGARFVYVLDAVTVHICHMNYQQPHRFSRENQNTTLWRE